PERCGAWQNRVPGNRLRSNRWVGRVRNGGGGGGGEDHRRHPQRWEATSKVGRTIVAPALTCSDSGCYLDIECIDPHITWFPVPPMRELPYVALPTDTGSGTGTPSVRHLENSDRCPVARCSDDCRPPSGSRGVGR